MVLLSVKCTLNFFVCIQEPLTLTRLDNSIKADKPKPVRRKNVPDSIMAPLLDSKSTQHPPTNIGNAKVKPGLS